MSTNTWEYLLEGPACSATGLVASRRMNRGLCNDEAEPPIVRRLRQPVQHLKRIGQTSRDRLRTERG